MNHHLPFCVRIYSKGSTLVVHGALIKVRYKYSLILFLSHEAVVRRRRDLTPKVDKHWVHSFRAAGARDHQMGRVTSSLLT